MGLALSGGHLLGFVITLAGITLVGVYAGRMVKSAKDFSVGGRRAGAVLVAGTIMGTLIGGVSTIGTAQMAFEYGFCAWWFTLGSGAGCAVLGLVFARRLREAPLVTIPQYLALTYGDAVRTVTSVISCACFFLGIVAQGLAAAALFTSMIDINAYTAVFICALLVLGYVFFGGIWGTGMVGMAKVALVYMAVVTGGLLAWRMAGGYGGLAAELPSFPWFSFFGRGFGRDITAGISLFAGVLCSQLYIQAVFSARSLVEARRGALISALMVPPVGFCGVLVGLYMRAHFPETPSGQVLPAFIIKFLPPVPAGVMLAGLLVVVIGTWAGVTLGVSTMLTEDFYVRYVRPGAKDRELLIVQRLLIFLIIAVGAVLTVNNFNSMIMGWVVLSMGIQSCSVFFPLLGAVFFPRLAAPRAGFYAAVSGPLAAVLWHVLSPGEVEPFYPGILASFFAFLLFCTRATKYTGLQSSCKNRRGRGD